VYVQLCKHTEDLENFYRDYLGRKEVIEGLKFPNHPFKPKKIPSRGELREFYQFERASS